MKRAEDFASGIYVLAQAKEIVTSGDLSGWTVEGLKPGVLTLVGVRNGPLRLNVCGGTCLVFRRGGWFGSFAHPLSPCPASYSSMRTRQM